MPRRLFGVPRWAFWAPALGIAAVKGVSGYFAVFVGGPIGALLVLRQAGPLSVGRLALVVAGVLGVGAAVLSAFWIMRPLVNANGLAPQLVFEIRLPPAAAPSDANAWAIELQTSRNRMPATLETPRPEKDATSSPKPASDTIESPVSPPSRAPAHRCSSRQVTGSISAHARPRTSRRRSGFSVRGHERLRRADCRGASSWVGRTWRR